MVLEMERWLESIPRQRTTLKIRMSIPSDTARGENVVSPPMSSDTWPSGSPRRLLIVLDVVKDGVDP